jgi:aminomethyltransferase
VDKKTPLYDSHVALGGKMVPFAGYILPVQYPSGVISEHMAVRTACGLFDVSHMGEVIFTGPDALNNIQMLVTNDMSTLNVGQVRYSPLCNDQGGFVDDLIVYRMDEERYMLVVNASNRQKDFLWISSFVDRFDATVTDRSDETGLIAVQGPRAADVLAKVTTEKLDGIGYYRFGEGAVAGRPAVISRTGYTGEDGFELYLANEDAAPVWRTLLDAGAGVGIAPTGLGARDSLRLEMGYALYGNDLDETRTPLEAGLGWVTKLDKGDFVARDALLNQKSTGVAARLVGFRLNERGFPRPGYDLAVQDQLVGKVTSGTLSPTLGIGIGMGYVSSEYARPGTPLSVVIRGQKLMAEVTRPPFYTQGSIRR